MSHFKNHIKILLLLVTAAAVGFVAGCVTKTKNNCAGANPDPSCSELCGTCTADKPVCNVSSEQCVECLSDADCKDGGKAHCDSTTNSCVACAEDAQCSHLTATPLCNVSKGSCYACTRENQATVCNGNVCNNQTGACTTTPLKTLVACKPCVADDECKEGYVCAPTVASGKDIGEFCLPKKDATGGGLPNGNCSANGRPFYSSIDVTSVDGEMTSVCASRTATCPALNDFSTKNCGGTESSNHAQCGFERLDDGYCVQVGNDATFQCTIPCVSDADCKIGTTCDGSASGYNGTVCKL